MVGFSKGFLKIVYSLVSWIVILVVVIVATPYIENYLKNDKRTVEIVLDLFENIDGQYYRYSEKFKEKAYDDVEITDMLEKSGFKVLDKFDELTFNEPTNHSQRVFSISRSDTSLSH